MKANELKKGVVFAADGKNIMVKQVQVQAPSSRSGNTLYKIRGVAVSSGQKFERNFKGDETVVPVDIGRRKVQLLFRDAHGCTFMDNENYEQYTLSDEAVANELPFLSESLEGITGLASAGVLLGIELPATISLEIADCAPGIRGASSSARTKPATLSTGLVVQVPEYLAPGDRIKVNTETREFVSRG